MKLNTRARYALRLMIDMAGHYGSGPMTLTDISLRQGISKRYLGQIAVSLKNNSLIKGVPGKSGGYRLARHPDEITVQDIFRAVIGPVNIVECVKEPTLCSKSESCECRPVYWELNRSITGVLSRFTLSDLVEAKQNIGPDGDTSPSGKKAGNRSSLCSTADK